MRDAFTVEQIENLSSLLTVWNHLVNRWLVAHVALWLLGSFLSRWDSLDGLTALWLHNMCDVILDHNGC